MEVVFKSQSFCPRNARFILLPRLKDRSVLLLPLAESVGSVESNLLMRCRISESVVTGELLDTVDCWGEKL